ncbi:MAG TPA: hypothetical protein QGH10_12700, partial [Armatimonadota bacterium]|nr:hypothetical protein [Armatimonadota bacterium]
MASPVIALVLAIGTLHAQAPTFQDLMAPEMLPEAQMGMRVEGVSRRGGAIRVLTTGADVRINLAKGEVRFGQRIGARRTVATLRTGRAWSGATVTHDGEGFARIVIDSPRLTIRINGDSLFMLHANEPIEAAIDRRIQPVWNTSYLVNHLIADELGAFGIYCSDELLDDGFDAYARTVATYALPADEVLWLGVCPPKEYPWERSIESNVVWHWH